MDIPRVSSSVQRITVLKKDESGVLRPVLVFKRRQSKKKKGTAPFSYFEKIARRVADAQARSAQSYRTRHDRSNQREKDGWVRDLPINLIRANQKGNKTLRVDTLFFD